MAFFVDRLALRVDFACSALRMREVTHSRGEVGRVCAAGSHATAELTPCSNPDNNKGIGLLFKEAKFVQSSGCDFGDDL